LVLDKLKDHCYHSPVEINMSKFNAGKVSLLALIAVSGLSLLMLFNSLTSVIAKQENNDNNHQNQNNDNHEENNNDNNNENNNHENNNDHEDNNDEKKDVCPNIESDQESLPSGYHFETINRVENCIKDADPIIPVIVDDGDVCHNIDGVQYTIPEGQHLDATGQNCVNFSGSGPAPRNDEGVGGAVLGASTGQVLGASTMAGTGAFDETLYSAIMSIGATLSAFGLKGLKKAKKISKK
jgi:hypothetical protein